MADETLAIDGSGAFAVEVSPLFGSTNLDANMTAGTIFAISEAGSDEAALLQETRSQPALRRRR